MYSFLRNSCLATILFVIGLSVLKCGSSGEEKKDNPASEHNTYKNLDSNVKYVGILACRQCHYDKYETFIETGMGKSFDQASKKKSSAKFDKHSVIYDKFSDLSYQPFWLGDTMKIMEFRLEGKDTIHKRIENVDYIIGSGQHTNSHILNMNGYLHQMPMTYYTQDEKWDFPPGFEAGFNTRFSRKIGLECMSCHNALPDFEMGSENKFNKVPNGISCERCHGPGEIHVKEKTAGIVVDTSKYIDYSILNPAKLSIDLQFDVCQRCHLQGNTVLKEDKSFFDFKPGMKLSEVMTIFLPKYEGADDEFIMASHVDRLKQSPCFIKSNLTMQDAGINNLRPHKNGLTCITCHNPHVSVHATGKEIFNTACKNCHTKPEHTTCTESEKIRNKIQDNCVSCHMPRSGSIDIPHVTVTDHFIKKPAKKTNIANVKKFIGLVAINEKNPQPKVKAEAYINQFEKFDNDPTLLDSAGKYLNEKYPTDIKLLIHLHFLKSDFKKVISLISHNFSTDLLNKKKKSYDNADAWTCYRIAESYENTGNAQSAFIFYKKASELAPYNPEFLNKLAGNFFGQGKQIEAKKIYEKIIAANPYFAPAWCNLGFINLQYKEFDKAMEFYNKALALDPDYEQALLNKSGLLIYLKKEKEALAIAKRILKKNPKNEQALAIQMRFTK